MLAKAGMLYKKGKISFQRKGIFHLTTKGDFPNTLRAHRNSVQGLDSLSGKFRDGWEIKGKIKEKEGEEG